MTSRQGARRGLAGVIIGCSLVALVALWVAPATVLAAARHATTPHAANESRPSQAVAYARIGVVRVLAYYVGTGSDGIPIPEQVPCASDGVLVGAVGSGLNSYSYVLAPTAALSPITPCAEAQAAFQQLYSAPSSWSLSRIDVLLNVAYTGTDAQQIGSVRYSIAPAQILTNGGADAPGLLVLPLAVPSGMPSHDLPVLSLPQPSDAPATGPSVMLDLAGPTGDLIARTAIDPTTVLYPVDLPADQILPPAKDTPTATGTTGPTPAQLSLGAPAINSNGRLIGIITLDRQGKHVLASASTISRVIASVTSKPGPLMTKWQEGLAAYYADPAQYSPARSAFSDLQASYGDFGGVAPFLTAAKQSSATIPPLTQPAPSGSTPGTTGDTGGQGPPITTGNMALLIGLIVALAVLVIGGLLALVVRARDRRAAQAARAIPPEEVGLSLLPRESMYTPAGQMDIGADYGTGIEDAPTGQMPAVPSGAPAPSSASPMASIDEMPTLGGMPALAAVMRAGPTGPRKTTSLVARVAGKTDPGQRRAGAPNQDNILAMVGIRVAGNRPQPYGFFVVADGMGGHEHGREASAAAIQVYAQVVGDGLRGQQPLDSHTLTHLLRQGIQQAHEDLRRRNAANQADMGTTITAALVVDDTAYIANVGDSRTYVMSPDTGLRQITTDHSIVASLAAAGVIRPEEIYTHPRRNQIYRSLGGEPPEIEIDTFTTVLQAGDKLLLCSDGLWEMVRDPQIEHILRATADPQQAVDLLVREANANGGEDNISAIVARMVEELPEHAQPEQRILIAPEGQSGRW